MQPQLKTTSSNPIIQEMVVVKNHAQPETELNLDALLRQIIAAAGKKSFLVFKRNKYVVIPTEQIAFFYVKYEATVLVSFDKQEYFVDYSLEQVQTLVTEKQFFRMNRQYLVNFHAIKEVEHYFSRKLLANLVVPSPEILLISKEKSKRFLEWMENR